MTKQEAWFIRERAEAFASLVLTRRPDVTVQGYPGTDVTIDLLAEVREEGKSTSRTFAAELIGYLDLPDIQDADERVLSDGGRTASEGKLPICAFVIGVRKPEGIWRWVVEPVIEDGRAVLRPGGKRNWHALDDAGIARLVKQVNAWYGAREEEPKANHEK